MGHTGQVLVTTNKSEGGSTFTQPITHRETSVESTSPQISKHNQVQNLPVYNNETYSRQVLACAYIGMRIKTG